MENATKVLILFSGIGIWSCTGKEEAPSNRPGTNTNALKSGIQSPAIPKKTNPIKFPIGNGLFQDSLGTLYLKTKNRRMQTPSNETDDWPDSIFHSKVSLRDSGGFRSLTDMLDTASFSRIDEMGVYFEDSAFIYVYSIWPYPDQFFALKKTGARFLDTKKEYLLVGGALYSHGKIVENIDASKSRAVRFKKIQSEGFHEFITDGRVLVVGYSALNEKRLSDFDNISEKDREKIRRRYLRPDSTRLREKIP